MVNLSKAVLAALKKSKSARGGIMDSLRLRVYGGHGGNGMPRYGGVGGQGGCVYFVAKEGASLQKIQHKLNEKKITASSGEDSSKLSILGRRGVDARLEVPVGVRVIDENGKLLADLNKIGEKCIVAGGGIGGCSGTNYLGKPGETRTVNIDLRLIADVGLVGFPNAGKSTFLKGISRANPKIADYPFTTIRPQIGVIQYPDNRSIKVADLPGLIEGAHKNFGMGHEFLKHVERTRLLLFIVDIFGFCLNTKHEKRSCLENIYALNKELELYNPRLLAKPSVLLINKMDQNGSLDELKKIKPIIQRLENGLEDCPEDLRPTKLINFERIIPMSAKNSARLLEVKNEIRSILDGKAESHYVRDPTELRKELVKRIKESGPEIL